MARRFVANLEQMEQRALLSTVTLFNQATPSVTDSGDPGPVEVGVLFHSDVAGTIKGVMFYESAANSGPHTVTLWDAAGHNIFSQTSSDSGEGWKELDFGFPVKIQPNVNYTASVYDISGHYAVDQAFFSQPHDATPLHADNGVFHYGNGGVFPQESWNDSNYWVDVVFTPEAPPAFTVNLAGAFPAPGARNVALNTQIFVSFTMAPDLNTINSSNFILINESDGSFVPLDVSYGQEGGQAILVPQGMGLQPLTTYVVEVYGGPDGVLAKDGTQLDSTWAWPFTTASA